MRLFVAFGILIALGSFLASPAGETNAQVAQHASDCSVIINGNDNSTASLVCNAIDPKIAEQIKTIVNGTHRNENALKDISEKLDRILKQMDVDAIPPVVALRFVYPKFPALELVNESDAVARDMKWSVILWNADLPDRNDPLPIPVSTFDWLKPHAKGGPQNLFGTPLVAPLLKPGSRLIGTASVNCPACSRGRTYLVSIVWGKGGWFSELENEHSGNPVYPSRLTKEMLTEYFKEVESIPENLRTAIAENP